MATQTKVGERTRTRKLRRARRSERRSESGVGGNARLSVQGGTHGVGAKTGQTPDSSLRIAQRCDEHAIDLVNGLLPEVVRERSHR